MGGWAKILINYSLESPQYCRGVSHTPAPYKPKLPSILIKEIPRFSNSRLYKSTTQNLIGSIFLKNESINGQPTAWVKYFSTVLFVAFLGTKKEHLLKCSFTIFVH